MKVKVPEYIDLRGHSLFTIDYNVEYTSLVVNRYAHLNVEALGASTVYSDEITSQFLEVPQNITIGPDTSKKLSEHPVNGSISLYQGLHGSSECSDIRFYASQANPNLQGNLGNFRIEGCIDDESWMYNRLRICHYKDNTTSTPSGEVIIDAAGYLSSPNISANHIASNTATFTELTGYLKTLYAKEALGSIYVISVKIERFSGDSSSRDTYIPRGTYICSNKLVKAGDNENYGISSLIAKAHMTYTTGNDRHHFYILQDIEFTLAAHQTETVEITNILAIYAGVAPYNQITPL